MWCANSSKLAVIAVAEHVADGAASCKAVEGSQASYLDHGGTQDAVVSAIIASHSSTTSRMMSRGA